MSTGKIFAILGLVGVIFAGIFALNLVGFHNTETGLRAQYEAKTDANRADFDNMWKTIKQVAQVPDQHKAAFKDVMTSYAEARSSGAGEGSFLSIMKEAVPDFTGSTELFGKIQTVVEAKRESWTTRQKEIRDIKREHDVLVRQFPGAFYNVFLGRDELVVVLVTSSKTDEAFTTGADEDVDLFSN